MSKLKKYLIVLGIIVAVFTVFGFFGVPPILKSVLTKQLSQNLHRDVSIRQIKFNPYVLSLTVRDLLIKDREPGKTFVSFDELYLNLQIMSALRRAIIFKEIRLKKPFINLVRHADFTYNFSDLMEKKDSKTQPKPGAKSRPLRFSLNNITIEGGSIDLLDEPVQKKHTVRDMNVGMPFVSNFPSYINTFVQPAFSAKVNGTAYALKGRTKPFADSRETVFDIDINDLDIPYYLAYVPMKLNVKIPSAFLDTRAKLSFVEFKNRTPSLTISGDVAIKKIAVDDEKSSPLIRLPRLDVAIAPSEPLMKKVHLAKISIQSPEIEIRRDQKGTINFQTLLPKEPVVSKPKESPKPTPKPLGKDEQPVPLSIEIDEIGLTGGKISFSDLSRPKPFKTRLDPVELKIDHFSNAREKKTNYLLSLVTEAKENVKLDGELMMDPMSVDGSVDVKSLILKKYSPYYMESILFDIEDGRLDFSTRYRYAAGDKEPAISLQSMSAAVASLRLKRRYEKEDFFKTPVISLKDTQVDLPRKELKLGSLFTEKGMLSLTRFSSGEFDLQKLFPPAQPARQPVKAQGAGKPERPWTLTLAQVLVDQYTVRMNDQKAAEPTILLGEKVKLSAENLTTEKNRSGKMALSFLLDKKGTVSTRCNVGLDPMKVDGSLEVKNIVLKNYSPYYRDSILFDIEEGELGLSTTYHYAKKEKDQEIKLSRASLSVERLRLQKRDEPGDFATIPALSVKNTDLDLINKEVSVGEVAAQKGSLLVRRYSDGRLNVTTLFPEPPKPGPSASSPGEKSVDRPVEKPWLIKIGKVSLDQYSARVEDRSTAEPVNFIADGINLSAENLSTAKGQKGNISLALRLNQKGTLSLNGPLGINPVFANLKTSLKGIEIRHLQPYFTDRIKIAVEDGSISTTGSLTVNDQEGKGFQVTYKGESSLNNFVSVDKLNSEDFLKWDSLSFENMDVGYNPLYVNINGITLSNFYARVIIFPDGTMNIANIFEGETKKAQNAPLPSAEKKDPAPQPGPQPARNIKIDKITLQGGKLDYADNYIKPNYLTRLDEIGGRISGLSSEEGKTAEVELRAKMDNSAPLEITGKVNPLREDLYVDLAVKFTDMDLSSVTPYSGKYVGYSIQKGKLSLELKYLVLNRKLDAQNKIFFDQLTLGDKMESSTATKLPVKLGIALLKDRKGEIDLDIPVSGSLDDPQFSVFSIVIKVITNLLVKAATSPFSLLGSVFGGGEQLEYIEFDYGSYDIRGENEKKMNTLAKILQDRPGVKLEVESHVDMAQDKEGLRRVFFNRKVKAQKLKEMIKKGVAPVPVDEVKIDPPEYAKYLKGAYKEEKFPKPKNFLGMDKDIPAPEMEKLMLTNIVVTENDLRSLATQRSQKVKEVLLKAGQIQPERIFIVEPKSLGGEKKEKVKDSRVNFKLG